MPTIGLFPRECAEIAGLVVHMYICSAPATEYYGHLRHLALKFAHLDMIFLEIVNYKAVTGLLPELWGVQPMSETTKSFLKDEPPMSSEPKADFGNSSSCSSHEITLA